MLFGGKETDRLTFYFIYLIFSCLIGFYGLAVLDSAAVSGFTRRFLFSWEMAFSRYISDGGTLPAFQGSNHVEYMEKLVSYMKDNDINLPESNTSRVYEYLISQVTAENEEVFIICFSERIVLYGISKETFEYIDWIVDGRADFRSGKFTGEPGRRKNRYIGSLRI